MSDRLADASEAEMLAHELMRFAARIRGASEQPYRQATSEKHDASYVRVATAGTYLQLAQKMYHARRARNKFLPPELFGEPIWDMLLDLYCAQAQGREINVSSLAIASCVPETTALRYMTVMEESGLIERYNAAHDRRVHFIRLTVHGARRLQRYFTMVGQGATEGGPALLVAVK